jgi:hypothetical protein
LTPAQFRKQFNDLHHALKRLKAKLPPADRQNEMFNYLRLLGESYAAAHGPHPGIEPRKLPSFAGLLEDEPRDFNSEKRLRGLIDGVDQVSRWMNSYNEDLVPKMGWSKLEKIYGRTHTPELWLIGKELPKIFENHFGQLQGKKRAKRGASPGGSRSFGT